MKKNKKSKIIIVLALTLLNLATASLFLFSTSSGTNSALVSPPLDDLWIHLVYASNLAEHHRPYYNPGQLEAGMTSPLWTLLLSLPIKIGLPPVLSAKILSLLFFCLSVFLLFLLFTLFQKEWLGLLAASLLSLDPFLSLYKISGMEISFFIFLLLLASYSFLKNSCLLTGLFSGLLVLTRPEGYIFFALVILSYFFLNRKSIFSSLNHLKNLFKLILPFALLNLPSLLYHLYLIHKPLPATFYAKTSPFILFNLPQLKNAFLWLLRLPYFITIIGLFFLFLGYLFLYHPRYVSLTPPDTPRRKLFLLALFPFLCLYFFSAKFFIIPLFGTASSRYLVPLTPFFLIAFVFGLYYFYRFLSRLTRHWKKTSRLFLITTVLILMLFSLPLNLLADYQALIPLHSWNTRNIHDMQETMGQWLRQNLPPQAKIGVDDAGAIRYFAGKSQQIIDLVGLNNRRLVGRGCLKDPSYCLSFIKQQKIDYLVVYDNWHPNLKTSLPVREIYNLTIINNTICGNGLPGDETMKVYKVG